MGKASLGRGRAIVSSHTVWGPHASETNHAGLYAAGESILQRRIWRVGSNAFGAFMICVLSSAPEANHGVLCHAEEKRPVEKGTATSLGCHLGHP